jgi:hypothetical protein
VSTANSKNVIRHKLWTNNSEKIEEKETIAINSAFIPSTQLLLLLLFHGPGVDSAPRENVYQEHFWG